MRLGPRTYAWPTLITAAAFTLTACAGSMAHLSRADEVEASSRIAQPIVAERLESVLGDLPAVAQSVGGASLDRCLRDMPFEGEPAGPMRCQWRSEEYLVLDGDISDIESAWTHAFEAAGWRASHSRPNEILTFSSADSPEMLTVTFASGAGDLDNLLHERLIEGTEKHVRSEKTLPDSSAIDTALTDGRNLARVSVLRAYYSEDNSIELVPLYW